MDRFRGDKIRVEARQVDLVAKIQVVGSNLEQVGAMVVNPEEGCHLEEKSETLVIFQAAFPRYWNSLSILKIGEDLTTALPETKPSNRGSKKR